MYDRDVPIISKHALASPAGLYDVIEFTLCTINMPLSRVHIQRDDIRRNGLQSKWLSQHKRNAVVYARAHDEHLWNDLHAILAKHDASSLDAAHAACMLFLRIPTIGAVKAGFISQMCGINVACLDRHNVRAMGLPETAFTIDKNLKPDTLTRKVRDYAKVCRRKGADYWWDTWCNFVADRGGMNKSLTSGDAVSQYHVDAVLM